MTWLIIAMPFDPVAGAERPVYLSDMGFTTMPWEDPANVYFERRISVPMRIERSLWEGDALGGYSGTEWGPARISNDDGTLDWLDDLEWGGRPVRILHSAKVQPTLADFQEVFSGTSDEVTVGDDLEIPLLDLKSLLEEPFTRGQFAGTGGVEGVAALTGVEKPVCLGIAMNIQPVEIDPLRHIYMVDPSGFSRLLRARTGGDLLENRGPDVATWDELAGLATMAASGWDHALSSRLGLIRLTARPQGPFTVDVEGAKTSGTFRADTSSLVRHVLAASSLSAERIDEAAFDRMRALVPAPLGFYAAAPSISTRALIDQLAEPAGCYWGFRQGLLGIGRFEGADQAGAPVWAITERDVISISPRPSAQRMRSLKVAWRRYWSTLGEDQIVAGTPVEDRVALQQEWRWVEKGVNVDAAANALLATDEELLSLFHHEGDAINERDRRLALYGPKAQSLDVTIPWPGAGSWLGQTGTLAHSRFGLAMGKRFVVIAESDEIDGDREERRVTLWRTR